MIPADITGSVAEERLRDDLAKMPPGEREFWIKRLAPTFALIESQRATIERVELEASENASREFMWRDQLRLAEARVTALEAEKAGLVAALEDLAIHVSMGWETDDVMLAARAALSRSTEKNDGTV